MIYPTTAPTQPHYDIEAETGLIALSFENLDTLSYLVAAGVTPDWFGGNEAAWVFDVLCQEAMKPGVRDLSEYVINSAITRLKDEQGLTAQENIALRAYFKQAIGSPVPYSKLEDYYSRIMTSHQQRLYSKALKRAESLVEARHVSLESKLQELETEISLIRRVATPFEVLTAKELAETTTALFTERLENGNDNARLFPLPLDGLMDSTDGGLRPNELTLVSAPPKVGKTSLVMDMAACQKEQVIVFFSLEMNRYQWTAKRVQQETGIPSRRIEQGKFHFWRDKVLGEIGKLAGTKLYFVDNPSTSTELVKRVLEHVRRVEGRVDMVYIDYAQLLKDDLPGKSETAVANYVAGQLKALPKTFDCHVVAISNLNYDGKLYGTSFLGYHCDNWWVVQNDKATDDTIPLSEKSGDAKIIMKYQRYGNSGEQVPVYWNASYSRFTDPSNRLPIVETKYQR